MREHDAITVQTDRNFGDEKNIEHLIRSHDSPIAKPKIIVQIVHQAATQCDLCRWETYFTKGPNSVAQP